MGAATLAERERGEVGRAALGVLGVRVVFLDLWVRQRDDLTAVAAVGESFLLAGHRGVEAHLAINFNVSADGSAGENGSGFEC